MYVNLRSLLNFEDFLQGSTLAKVFI